MSTLSYKRILILDDHSTSLTYTLNTYMTRKYIIKKKLDSLIIIKE